MKIQRSSISRETAANLSAIMGGKRTSQQNNSALASTNCCHCGSINASRYAITSMDTWATFRKAYEKSPSRYLCVDCIKRLKPSHILALEKNVTKVIRDIPIFDKSGKFLPQTTRQQIEALPHHYPLRYLAEQNIIATYLELIRIANCKVLKLVPLPEQHGMMDIHVNLHGCIYSTVNTTYNILSPVEPFPIKITSHYDEDDHFRIDILYRSEQFHR